MNQDASPSRRMGDPRGLLNSVFNPLHPEKRRFHDDNLSGAAARNGPDAAYAASAAARCLRTNRQSVSSEPSATK